MGLIPIFLLLATVTAEAIAHLSLPAAYSSYPAYSSNAVLTLPYQRTRYHAQDERGQYVYGYFNEDGQFKTESRTSDGSVVGQYGYSSPDGNYVLVKYTAGVNGFQAEHSIVSNDGVAGIPLASVHTVDSSASSGNQAANSYSSQASHIGTFVPLASIPKSIPYNAENAKQSQSQIKATYNTETENVGGNENINGLNQGVPYSDISLGYQSPSTQYTDSLYNAQVSSGNKFVISSNQPTYEEQSRYYESGNSNAESSYTSFASNAQSSYASNAYSSQRPLPLVSSEDNTSYNPTASVSVSVKQIVPNTEISYESNFPVKPVLRPVPATVPQVIRPLPLSYNSEEKSFAQFETASQSSSSAQKTDFDSSNVVHGYIYREPVQTIPTDTSLPSQQAKYFGSAESKGNEAYNAYGALNNIARPNPVPVSYGNPVQTFSQFDSNSQSSSSASNSQSYSSSVSVSPASLTSSGSYAATDDQTPYSSQNYGSQSGINVALNQETNPNQFYPAAPLTDYQSNGYDSNTKESSYERTDQQNQYATDAYSSDQQSYNDQTNYGALRNYDNRQVPVIPNRETEPAPANYDTPVQSNLNLAYSPISSVQTETKKSSSASSTNFHSSAASSYQTNQGSYISPAIVAVSSGVGQVNQQFQINDQASHIKNNLYGTYFNYPYALSPGVVRAVPGVVAYYPIHGTIPLIQFVSPAATTSISSESQSSANAQASASYAQSIQSSYRPIPVAVVHNPFVSPAQAVPNKSETATDAVKSSY